MSSKSDIRVLIERLWQEEDKQTLGRIQVLNDNGGAILNGYCLELPDKNNAVRISRILEGDYNVSRRTSPKYGNHFHILDVEGRTLILIHAGNYYTETEGCVLVGYDYADINHDGLYDVTQSKKFLNKMLELLPGTFALRIVDDKPVKI